MHSVLACRMLLELREYGKHSVRGDEFKEFSLRSFQEVLGEV